MSDHHEPVRLRDLRSDADPLLRRLLDTAKDAGHDRSRLSALEDRILRHVELNTAAEWADPMTNDAIGTDGTVGESWWVRLRADRAALAKVIGVIVLASTVAVAGAIRLTQLERAQRSQASVEVSSGRLVPREPAASSSPKRPAGSTTQTTRAALATENQPARAQSAQPAAERRERDQPPVGAQRQLAPAADPMPTEATLGARAQSPARGPRDVRAASRVANASRRRAAQSSQATSGRAVASDARAESSGAPRQTSVPPELELLAQAQQALQDDPTKALELVAQHARAYPTGAFVEEREAIAVEALIVLGRAPEGRARGQAFLSRHRGSAYAPRVAHLIHSVP